MSNLFPSISQVQRRLDRFAQNKTPLDQHALKSSGWLKMQALLLVASF
jgi:hypothetical protein